MEGKTYAVKKSITIPIPRIQQFHPLTLFLRPHIPIRDRRIEAENHNTRRQKHRSRDHPQCRLVLNPRHKSSEVGNSIRDEVVHLAQSHDREEQGGEIMVEEELALHEEEREIMERPAKDRGADLVVETLEDVAGAVVITVPLPPQHRERLEGDVQPYGRCACPPDERVAVQVYLPIIFAPEIDAAAEDGPGRRSGVPGVTLHEPGIGRPHHSLQLPEFAEEARVAVIHFLRRVLQLGVDIALDVPDRIRQCPAAGAGHFLLFKPPVRQFDFVGEQDATGHDVHELEFRLDGAESFFRFFAVGHRFHDFDAVEVVGVTLEAFIAVGGDFVLPVCFGDRWAHVV